MTSPRTRVVRESDPRTSAIRYIAVVELSVALGVGEDVRDAAADVLKVFGGLEELCGVPDKLAKCDECRGRFNGQTPLLVT